MRKTGNLMILILLFLFACCSGTQNDIVADRMLNELLASKNFFKLRSELENVQNRLSECRLLYYRMHCEHAFDKMLQSNECADILLNKHKKQLNDTIISEILTVRANNYIRTYRYKEAAETFNLLLTQYSNALDSSDIADYQNTQALYAAFSAVKPQQINIAGNVEIKAYHNRFNHLMMPVKCGGIADEFIFDSGANLSTITDSCAIKMGLTIFESDIKVGTSTDIKIQTKLGVADSLYVGDILFENVTFLVIPAKQMTFPSVSYEIHGIIGFPVLHQMGEIRTGKDGTVTVPQKPENKRLENMFLYGLHPVVQLLSGNDTLLFTLDTGARSSELSNKYYENHSTEVEQKGKLHTTTRGGAGGIVEIKEYILTNFPYRIGNNSSMLPEISVILQEYGFNKFFDGNLGQDVIMQFDTFILNFKDMYIDFE
jgi:predicted aspartyl protease